MNRIKVKTLLRGLVIGVAGMGLLACSTKDKAGPVIDTPQGPVQGLITENGVHNIKGIPYAAPPVGDLRWRPPAGPANWKDIRAAADFGPDCMQSRSSGSGFVTLLIDRHGLSSIKTSLIKKAIASQPQPPVSEDCLYLNIRTPNIDADGAVSDNPLPVMVWIHGGGHQFGSPQTSLYQGDALPQKGVVLVTINYRLNAFGYMAHPALSADDPRGVSGNYGTLDQIAALKWVRNNITAYGGDPDNVTIFGESAGAWSVTELMTSPLAKGLFHKAIGQSGASTYHLGQLDKNEAGWISGYEGGELVAAALGLKNPSAEDLRAVPAQNIIDILTDDMSDSFHHNRDGVVFPKNVGIAFQDRDVFAVPAIFGYNSDEATVFYPDDPEPTVWTEGFPREGREAQIAALKPHFGSTSQTIIDLYGLDQDLASGGEQMMGDEFFGVNTRFVSDALTDMGVPSYMYIFRRVPPHEKQTVGAFHIAEIPFVFGTPEKALGWSHDDTALSELMQSYWANFARTGNPNSPGLPNWPLYQGENWMQFSANNEFASHSIKDFRGDKINALEVGLLKKLDSIRPGPVSESE